MHLPLDCVHFDQKDLKWKAAEHTVEMVLVEVLEEVLVEVLEEMLEEVLVEMLVEVVHPRS